MSYRNFVNIINMFRPIFKIIMLTDAIARSPSRHIYWTKTKTISNLISFKLAINFYTQCKRKWLIICFVLLHALQRSINVLLLLFLFVAAALPFNNSWLFMLFAVIRISLLGQ